MIPFFVGLLTCLAAFFRSPYNLGFEILALRQQLGVLKRKHPRPRVHPINSIRAGFGAGRKVAGGNWDSRISQDMLESNLHEARN